MIVIGIDINGIFRRWREVPPIFMPSPVSNKQGEEKGSLNDLLDNAVRAYVCGAPAAAIAMCRAVLKMVVKDRASGAAPGSEMVMQYVVPLATFAGDEAALVKGLAARASRYQEPWLSFYEPAEMERVLVDAGFGDIVHFGTEEALERYLRSRTDGLRLPAYFQMIKARTI